VQTSHKDTILNVLKQGVAEMGSRFNEEILARTLALYEPYVDAAPSTQSVQRELSFGSHPRNVLDFYPCERPSPILLYVHGGGFVGGGKNINAKFYSNLGKYFTDRGLATALMNYRLAPEFVWPQAAEDIAKAVDWLQENRAQNQRIYIIGQSAGACHLATYLTGEDFHAHAAKHISGAVLMSGFYDARGSMSPGARSYFGDNPLQCEERSPILATHRIKTPVLLTLAQYDPAGMAQQTLALASQLTQTQQTSPPLVWLKEHNHVSTVLSIGSPQDDVGELITRFIKEIENQRFEANA
jgi:triacylglycerol lipase